MDQNIFDVLSTTKWAFVTAAMAVRSISTTMYEAARTADEQLTAADTALENAAVAADTLAQFTSEYTDANVHPDCMATLARETKLFLRNERSWVKVARRADELGERSWLAAIKEWAGERGMGEE